MALLLFLIGTTVGIVLGSKIGGVVGLVVLFAFAIGGTILASKASDQKQAHNATIGRGRAGREAARRAVIELNKRSK